MGRQGWRPWGSLPAILAAALLVAAFVALVIQAEESRGAALVSSTKTALWWVAVAILGGLLALGAWWLERQRARQRAARAAQEAAEQARGEAQAEAEREAEQARREADAAKADLEREAAQQRSLRRHEYDLNRELRRRIAELQQDRGSLGSWEDIGELVLRTAIALTDASKGLLLTRNGDGGLHVAAHAGFDGDPGESSLAERFGDEVIDQDTTIREDRPGDEPEGDDSAADREIENLVAIPIYVRDEFTGVVVCANRDGGFEEVDDDVLLALGDHAGAVLQNQGLHQELRGAYVATVRLLAEAIQAKDPFLRGHSEEVSEYVDAVARRLDIDSRRREELIFGSLLHDVGKIGISERILHKPAKLTPEEFAIIQLHPRIGYRLIEQVPALQAIAPAILHHHERFDGGGYPSGLRGEQIPLEARIVGVADAFSAMTSDRPYRSRMPLSDACEELERNAGTQFDPEIVRVFVEEVRKRPADEEPSSLDTVLQDAELQVHREPDEPVLGAGSAALTDSLTLLYAHRYLHELVLAEAERARVQGEPFSVVLASIDAVEELNRRKGYGAGDDHLRLAARALSRLAVHHGGTACRDGGVVLALVVPGTRAGAGDSDGLCDDVRSALRDFGPTRVAGAAWADGENGLAVMERARAALGVRVVQAE